MRAVDAEAFDDTDSAFSRVTIKPSHTFSKSGTHFPARRATSQRQGDSTTPLALLQNLGRVRLVVV